MSEEKRPKGKDLTRRSFLKTSGGVALAGVAAGTFIPGSQKVFAAPIPTKWDEEADVIILGFGGAGASAAIEAADAGAKVLLIEKQPEATHYSNTRMSGGIFHSPEPDADRGALKAYARAMFSGENIPEKLEGEQPHVSEGLAEVFAEYAPGNKDFLKKVDPDIQFGVLPGFEKAAFPQFPGAEKAGYKVFMATYSGRADLSVPTKDRPKSEKVAGEAFFMALKKGVVDRGVKVSYGTAAKNLVKTDAGEIIGVIAQAGGRTIACKARRGVVVTTGGYEYSIPMRRAFLEGPGVEGWAFYGTPENTGDGISMAMAVGAGLAKVGKAASRMIGALPIRHHGLKMGMITPAVGRPHSIVVDNLGKRFAAEHLITKDPSRYFFYKEAVKFDILELRYPRIPSWLIFDEELRAKVPLTYLGISTAAYGFFPWDKENAIAVKKGWILKADTIEALASKIGEHKENRGLMKPVQLAATVAAYNGACAKGVDESFGRLKQSLGPVDTAPYYALPLYPGGPNTKGGIDANARREVIDWEGKPIPRLFTAGEISSAFKFVYQGGGNLTECIVMGRIAGKNAAALAPWS